MAHIATVASITGTGTVYAVNALGVQRIVKAGDVLEKGETLRTVGDATVELLMDDGNLMAIAPDKTVHLDDNVSQSDTLPTAADSAISSSATSETIIQALERGTDLSTTLDATAAGLDGGGGGGNSFVQLLRISEGVDAQSYNFNFSGLGVLPIPEGVGVVASASNTVANVTASLMVNPIAGDGVINATEAQSPKTTVSGTVGGDVKVGDTVTILVNGHTTTTSVTTGEGGKLVFIADVATSDLSADSTVDVSVKTSNADQTAMATATAKAVVVFDTVAEAAISIDPVGNDIITAAQAVAGGNVMVTGTVGGDAKINDVVTVSVNGHETTGLVKQGPNGLIFSVPVAVANLVADKTIDASVKATDAYGNTVTTTAHHTVTGQSVASNEASSVTEDLSPAAGVLTATGAVNVVSSSGLANAVDPTSTTLITHTVTSNGVSQNTPALGTLNVHADGTYDFNVSNSVVQFLGQGDKIVQTYEVKSADGTATSTITITINGANDAPVISSLVQAGTVSEDGKLSVDGQVTVSDVDHDAVQAFSGNATTDNGTFTVNAKTGEWSYTLANHQDLSANDHLTEKFTVTVTDDQGAKTQQVVTISINGANDAPVISSLVQAGTVSEDGKLSVDGQVTVSDVDHDAVQAFSGNATTDNGTFTVNAKTGEWSYTLANHQDLSANDHLTEKFTVTVTDDQGAKTQQVVTISINGANDAPVISSLVQAGTVSEDGKLSVDGQVTVSDVDHDAVQAFSGNATTDNGTFTVNAKTGEWSYTLANHQDLSANDHLTEKFTVTVTDDQGAKTQQVVTISINGANDAPVISSLVQAGTVSEDGKLSVDGQVTVSDVDHDAVQAFSGNATTDNGTFTVNAKTGEWSYTLANHQDLSANDHLTEKFTVTVTDDQGAKTQQVVTISINGANDAPVISSLVQAGTVSEDGKLSVDGQVTVSDVDHDAVQAFSGNATTDNGTFTVNAKTGEWSYTLANHQDLSANDHLTEKFTVTVTDDQGAKTQQVVTISINGANDAPVISSLVQAGTVSEDGKLSVDGQVTVSDVDHDAVQAFSGNATTDNGTFTVNAKTGEWSYTLANHQDLSANDHLTEKFTVTVTDDQGAKTQQVVTISINGANDAPVISSLVQAGTVSEDGKLSVDGQVTVSDVDHDAVQAFSGNATTDNGTFTVNAKTGEWSYTLANHQDLSANDHLTEKFTVTVTDDQGAKTQQVVTISINGANDAPVISSLVQAGSVYEAGLDNGSHTGPTTKSVSGTFEVSDVDSANLEVTAAGALHGVVVLTPGSTPGAWSWTYTLTSNIDNDATGVNVEPGKDSFTLTVSDGNKSSSTVVNVSVIDDVPVAHVTSPGYLQYGESEHDKDVQDARDAQRKDQEDDGNHVSDAKSKLHEQESNRDAHDEQGSKRIADAEKSLKDAKEHYGSNSEKAHEAQGELDRAKNDQAKQHDLDEKSVKAANDELTAALNTQHQHEVDDEKRVQDGVDNAHLNTFSGTLASLGADAVGAHVTWDKPADVSLGDDRTLTYMLNPEKTLLQAFEQDQHGTSKLAFALAAHDDGTYLFTQYQTLDTKVNLSFGFTATDGDKDSVHVSAGSANSLQLATQNTMIGNHSEDGHEVGSSNNDFIKVGVGSHLLEGKEGADVFKWSLSEHDGSKLSIDHIKDFDVTTKGDTLDLRDLLHGSLDSDHLQFGKVGDKLALLVSHDGHLDSSGDGADVKIVLDNRDGSNVEAAKVTLAHELDSSFNGHSISDHDLLKKLVDTGHLKTDV